MKRCWSWLLAVPVLLLGALAALPASWLSVPLSDLTQSRWQLSEVQGTLWSGQGRPVFVAEDGSVLAMSRLAWQFDPLALFKGALGWRLHTDAGTGSLRLTPSSWQLDNISLSLPVAAIAGLSDTWRAARLGGLLKLELQSLAHGRDGFSGSARVSWLGAASPLTRIRPFGSYQLQVNGQGPALGLKLQTLSGPLQIDGQGQWQPGKLPDFGGSASSSADAYLALRPLMLMLGRPSGPDRVSWNVQTGV
ncbi:type II secretion system protein N [Craterilacuibacter sp. RT1T]|uniref:type II secretion system protein N n=1 Tax=Craterilacuibacter sp. RT1T TaxID=2942211 RepID=UPI0020BFB3B5|nr:type II secretion system protein N [Craterilacuibacter sp. RT1T]MCL6263589.1 type II secretion system protein N [Craterilacuibacter sp. RT1T]